MQALLLHFRQHGKKAIEKVAREQPALSTSSRVRTLVCAHLNVIEAAPSYMRPVRGATGLLYRQGPQSQRSGLLPLACKGHTAPRR